MLLLSLVNKSDIFRQVRLARCKMIMTGFYCLSSSAHPRRDTEGLSCRSLLPMAVVCKHLLTPWLRARLHLMAQQAYRCSNLLQLLKSFLFCVFSSSSSLSFCARSLLLLLLATQYARHIESQTPVRKTGWQKFCD